MSKILLRCRIYQLKIFDRIIKPESTLSLKLSLFVSRLCNYDLEMDDKNARLPQIDQVLADARAIKGIRDKVQLATKFGIGFDDKGNRCIRGDPAYVRAACQASLQRLDVDYIDLYYQHRIDPKVPIEVTVGEMKKLVEEGKVKYLGLSEASAADIRRAHSVHPITAVQLEWSLWAGDVEEDVIPTCRELGIGIVAYSPLGRGFFSGKSIEEFSSDDYRKNEVPRFLPKNFKRNKVFYEQLCALGAKKKATPGQLALAWVHHQGLDVAPIPGTTKTKNLEENIGAIGINLSKEELKELEMQFQLMQLLEIVMGICQTHGDMSLRHHFLLGRRPKKK